MRRNCFGHHGLNQGGTSSQRGGGGGGGGGGRENVSRDTSSKRFNVAFIFFVNPGAPYHIVRPLVQSDQLYCFVLLSLNKPQSDA